MPHYAVYGSGIFPSGQSARSSPCRFLKPQLGDSRSGACQQERKEEKNGRQCHREFGCDSSTVLPRTMEMLPARHHAAHPWRHGNANAVRIRLSRKPRTSSLRRMNTRIPAKPTAARVAMAYSAVAIPTSEPMSRRVREGTGAAELAPG